MLESCTCPLISPAAVQLSDDMVVAAMRGLTCVAYFVVSGWIIVSIRRRRELAVAVKRLFQCPMTTWTFLRCACIDPTEERLRSSVSASLAQRGHYFFVSVGVASMVFILEELFTLHVFGIWGTADHNVMHDMWENKMFLNTLFSGAICVMVALMKPNSLINDALHCAAHIQWLAFLWLQNDVLTFVVRIGQYGLGRLTLAAILTNTRLVCFLNVFSWIASFVLVSSSDELSEMIYTLQYFETVVFFLTCVVSMLVESSSRQMMLATEAATISARLERMSQGLLRHVCDAVFFLDEHLCLEDHSPALAALLLKGTESGTRGELFELSICEDDKDRFKNFMMGSSESDPAQCLHLHPLDACGTKVSVQLFHYVSEGRHLVGIKEDSERERGTASPEQEVLLFHDPSSLRSDHSSNASRARGRLSTRHSVSSIATEQADFEDVTLTVDASTSHLDVLGCEPPLPAPFDTGATPRMLNWVPARKHRKFQEWVQVSTDLVFAGQIPRRILVHLRLPHLQSSEGVLAECVLTRGSTTDEMRERGCCIVQIEVHRVRRMSHNSVSGTAPRMIRRTSL